jgi:hypothetical protein
MKPLYLGWIYIYIQEDRAYIHLYLSNRKSQIDIEVYYMAAAVEAEVSRIRRFVQQMMI